MVITDQELLHKLEEFPTIEKIINAGTILRNKVVSRAGKTSAVIFVPKFLLGHKLRVILVPEDSEVLGMSETLEKKFSEVAGLKQKARIQEKGNIEPDVEKKEEISEQEIVEDKTLEDDETY